MRTTCFGLLFVATFFTLLVVAPAPGHAQLFDQTTISFSFADDDILKDPGETRKNSPAAYIGGQAESPVDRVGGSVYNQTSSRLYMYKKVDTGSLYPEGALRLRLVVDSEGDYEFLDDSTYVALNWEPKEKQLLKLTMYPVDSDRFRLGYHYDLTWGGTRVFPKNFTRGLAPGIKLGWQSSVFDAFVGFKTALVRSPAEDILDNPGGNTNQFVERTYYGLLGGVAGHIPGGLTVRLDGGYFGKGTSTRSDVLGTRINAGGGSMAMIYRSGGEVGQRLDLRMYYQDPERFPISRTGDYDMDFGLEVAVEGSVLAQNLEDPDRFQSTKIEYSKAFAISTGLRLDTWRLHFDAIYRDLSYVVWNVPGFVPNQALPQSADLHHGGPFDFLPEFLGGEMFFILSSDYFIQFPRSMGLTPAVSVGMLLPATYQPTEVGATGQGPAAAEHSQGLQKTVVRGSKSGDWDILPAGEDELPVFLVKLDLRYNLSEFFSVVGEVSYTHDPNYAQVQIDPNGHAIRQFIQPDILGMGIVSEMTF